MIVLPQPAGRQARLGDTKGIPSLSLGGKAMRCTKCGKRKHHRSEVLRLVWQPAVQSLSEVRGGKCSLVCIL